MLLITVLHEKKNNIYIYIYIYIYISSPLPNPVYYIILCFKSCILSLTQFPWPHTLPCSTSISYKFYSKGYTCTSFEKQTGKGTHKGIDSGGAKVGDAGFQYAVLQTVMREKSECRSCSHHECALYFKPIHICYISMTHTLWTHTIILMCFLWWMGIILAM